MAVFSRYLQELDSELGSADSPEYSSGFFERLGMGMRGLALGLALTAALAGCKVTKYLTVTSEPPKARVDWNFGKGWDYIGSTPVKGEYWIDMGNPNARFNI